MLQYISAACTPTKAIVLDPHDTLEVCAKLQGHDNPVCMILSTDLPLRY